MKTNIETTNCTLKKLSDIAILLNGYAFQSKKYVSDGIRIMRIANVQDGYIADDAPCYYPNSLQSEIERYMLNEGDLLISLTGNVGRVGLITADFLPAALNQRVSCLRIKGDSVNIKYLFYYLRRKSFVEDCVKASKGVAQLNLSTKWLEQYPIPVPPISEQEHIVSRIEELFSELDKAEETLRTTKQQLAVYRQAVLSETFGNMDTVLLSVLCEHITDGDHMPPPKATSGIPFIMISNIENNEINWSNTNHVPNEYYQSIGEKRTPRKGDVLYTVTGSFGIPVLVNHDKKFCFQRHIALLRPNDLVLQKYLYYALQTPLVYSQSSKRATGTAQKTVGLGVLRTLNIPFVADKHKQAKMIDSIEARLYVCDNIEKTVDTALAQADAIRQSILKQAFEGEL